MKLFKTKYGIIIQRENKFYLVNENWDSYVNDDNLLDKMNKISQEKDPIKNGQELIDSGLEAPIGSQELW
ncbi:MAG: 2-hydroxyhepta-2,4-diene-1,7-dioate isomerase, partial [bacterium]